MTNTNSNQTAKPEWLNTENIIQTLDAREMIARGEHPLAQVLSETQTLEKGNIFLLVTPFVPAPLIEKVKANGLLVYTKQISDTEFRNYFYQG